MTTLMLIAITLSTLALSIVVSGVMILSIRDLVHAFSNNLALPSARSYKGLVKKFQVLPSVA